MKKNTKKKLKENIKNTKKKLKSKKYHNIRNLKINGKISRKYGKNIKKTKKEN